MKILALNTILCSFLIGCAQAPIRVEKLPEPPVITMPVTKLDSITSSSSIDEVATAYFDAVVQLKGSLQEAINALEIYRSK